MSIQRNKLNIGKARRRVRIRSALLLVLGACLIVSLVRALLSTQALLRVPYGVRWLMEMLTTLLVFGGGAYLGLCVLDGDHRKIVPMRRLSRSQMLWLTLLGALAVAPMTLASDLLTALFAKADLSGTQGMQSMRFAAMLVKSVLLVPVCEELFFRGYLLGALKPYGHVRAAVIVSLCFGLVHTMENLCVYALLSLLLCWMTLHTQSLLAPVLMHAGYNLTMIVLGSAGLSGLFAGWSLISCALRLLLCAAFMAALKRAYTARTAGGAFVLWEGGRLERREIALLAAALLLFLATLIMGG